MTEPLQFAPYVESVGDALVAQAFADATGGWVNLRSAGWEASADWDDVAPQLNELSGVKLVRELRTRVGGEVMFTLATGFGGAAVLLGCYRDGWYVTVSGESGDGADAALAAIRTLIPDREFGGTEANIDVTFWMAHPMTVCTSRVRPLPRLPWTEVASNYPAAVHEQLAELIGLSEPPDGGRLLVFHGPPGTGKTRFLQTLASEWSEWCDVHFVVDPEEMFNTALYLHSVALGEYDTDRWRLVVVEDGDEFIAADGKQRSGAAVARLLNVADGLIGQGLRLMILVSTNVDKVDFSAAIVRRGRCGALVEFPPFTAEEVEAWAAAHGVEIPGDGARTLAELFHP